ncbi:tRNA methyltransferase, has a role in tRNA modification [Microbotryomycetes sp. JL221]|nr:tRNA methyltransferase, has a role in tRNA modification [Microbotryomycetes sp. JL221]
MQPAAVGPVLPDVSPTVMSLTHALAETVSSTLRQASSSSSLVDNGGSNQALVPSAALLHPLGPCTLDRHEIEQKRTSFKHTLEQVRSSLNALSQLVLNQLDAGTSTVTDQHNSQQQLEAGSDYQHASLPPAVKAQRDKLCSLWKEASASEAVLHQMRRKYPTNINELLQDVTRKQRQWDRVATINAVTLGDHKLSSESQPTNQNRGDKTVSILETIAKQLGLVSFKDTSSQTLSLNGSTEPAIVEMHTLSIGGKVMVIDIEVLAQEGRVNKVKMSYVLEQQHDCDQIAQQLLELLKDVEASSVMDQAQLDNVSDRLQVFLLTLGELKKLDEWTEQSKVDCFAAYEGMVSDLGRLLQPNAAHG